MSSFQQFNTSPILTPARLVASSNESGSYLNGPLNNGVGATFTYATGATTIDSVAIALSDRILFAAQSAALQNGIYVVTQVGSSGVSTILTRAADFQCIEQMLIGQFVSVGAGTSNAGSIWTLIEPLAASVGVSSIIFAAA